MYDIRKSRQHQIAGLGFENRDVYKWLSAPDIHYKYVAQHEQEVEGLLQISVDNFKRGMLFGSFRSVATIINNGSELYDFLSSYGDLVWKINRCEARLNLFSTNACFGHNCRFLNRLFLWKTEECVGIQWLSTSELTAFRKLVLTDVGVNNSNPANW